MMDLSIGLGLNNPGQIMAGAVLGGPALTLLVYDTFTDTNGTSLDAHTPEIAPGLWTEQLGQWEIQSNGAQLATIAGDNQHIATIDPGAADVTIETSITQRIGLMDIGIIANYQDQNNHWLCLWRADGDVASILQRTAGVYTDRGSVATAPEPGVGSSGTIKVVTSGDTITLFINGVQKVTYTTSGRALKTQTRCGIRDYTTGGAPPRGATFNDFSVRL